MSSTTKVKVAKFPEVEHVLNNKSESSKIFSLITKQLSTSISVVASVNYHFFG